MPYHAEPIPTIVRWFLDEQLISLFVSPPHPALICFYSSSCSFDSDLVLICTSLLLCYIAMSLFLGATFASAALDRRSQSRSHVTRSIVSAGPALIWASNSSAVLPYRSCSKFSIRKRRRLRTRNCVSAER